MSKQKIIQLEKTNIETTRQLHRCANELEAQRQENHRIYTSNIKLLNENARLNGYHESVVYHDHSKSER